MGSECTLCFGAPDQKAALAAELEIDRIEQRYSRYLPDSVLARINRVAAIGGSIEVDDETAALLDFAFVCHRKSNGLFDITSGILRRAWDFSSGQVPDQAEVARWLPHVGLDKLTWERPVLTFPRVGMELDLGGIGKEYAADRAAEVCAAAGVAHGLVNLGGDIRVIGPQADGTPWPISILDPRGPGSSLETVLLTRGALATSGDYRRCLSLNGRRLGHILSPLTGWPVGGLSSVSVVADSCLVAGSVATIALLMGESGPAWLAGLGLRSLWVDSQGGSGRHSEPRLALAS